MNSGGDLSILMGGQSGRDMYDAVEWVAAQPWSNGRVGMSGNSGLGVAQWFAAAEHPPHLAAIAPWEATTEAYATMVCQGGILAPGFARDRLTAFACGLNRMEAYDLMVERYPLFNGYWADKEVKPELIEVPAYVVASYTSSIHANGTLANYCQCRLNMDPSPPK